jgi:hypothetical protein
VRGETKPARGRSAACSYTRAGPNGVSDSNRAHTADADSLDRFDAAQLQRRGQPNRDAGASDHRAAVSQRCAGSVAAEHLPRPTGLRLTPRAARMVPTSRAFLPGAKATLCAGRGAVKKLDRRAVRVAEGDRVRSKHERVSSRRRHAFVQMRFASPVGVTTWLQLPDAVRVVGGTRLTRGRPQLTFVFRCNKSLPG